MATTNLVSQTTNYLRGLARRRNSGIVTADDVVNFLTKKNVRLSQNERLSVTRQVLGAPNFYAIGYTRSARPEARSRTITAWTVA